jgi:tetratricopeptide (TPR) repeat protein
VKETGGPRGRRRPGAIPGAIPTLTMRRITLDVVRGLLVLVWVFAAPPIGAQPSSGGEEERLAGLIRTAEAEKDFGRVADAYRRVVELRPVDPAAWQGLGVAEALRGSFEEAIPALERALTLDGKLWGAALYLGISYYRTNRFDEAVRPLEKAKKLRPGDPSIHYWLGASHNAAGRHPAAITELRQAVKMARTDHEVLYLLARSYAEYAAQLEQRLLTSEPDSTAAARVRAGDAALVDSRQAAITELSRAIDRHPEAPGLHFDLGTLLWTEKRYDEAAAAFRREVVLDPSNAEVHRRLGAYLLETGRAAEAMRHVEMALRLRPDDESIQELRRVAAKLQAARAALPGIECKSVKECLERGNLARLTKILELRAGREKMDPVRRALARAYVASGRMEAAYDRLVDGDERGAIEPEESFLLAQAAQTLSRETADLILTNHPESARAHMMRGEALERQRGADISRALVAYQSALKLDSGLTGTHYAIGRVLWKLQRFDEAAVQLTAELRRNPHHGGAHYYLGRTYHSLGDSARAARHLEQAVAANPRLTDGWRALGRARMGIGQPELAVEAYRQALLNAPNDSGLYALLGAAHKAAGNEADARESFAMARRLSAARFQDAAGSKP